MIKNIWCNENDEETFEQTDIRMSGNSSQLELEKNYSSALPYIQINLCLFFIYFQEESNLKKFHA